MNDDDKEEDDKNNDELWTHDLENERRPQTLYGMVNIFCKSIKCCTFWELHVQDD